MVGEGTWDFKATLEEPADLPFGELLGEGEAVRDERLRRAGMNPTVHGKGLVAIGCQVGEQTEKGGDKQTNPGDIRQGSLVQNFMR